MRLLQWSGPEEGTHTVNIAITGRFSGKVIWTGDAPSLACAVMTAIQEKKSLRLANLSGSDLSDCNLRGSDLRGSNLRGSNLRGSDLRGCNLSGSDLRDCNLRGSDLRGSDLSGSDLRDCNLRGSDLSGCNLSGCNLSGSDLRGSDLRGSDGKPLEIPVVPNIDAAILAASTAEGCLLNMGNWHTCETAHCRAGWAIHLAGEKGHALESLVGSCAAGALIYAASRPGQRVPDFFADNENAMADMRKCAAAAPAVAAEQA
jgi:hypothetical protein